MSITQFTNVKLKGSCVLSDNKLTTSTGNLLTFPSAGGEVALTSDIPSDIATLQGMTEVYGSAGAATMTLYWSSITIGEHSIVSGWFYLTYGNENTYKDPGFQILAPGKITAPIPDDGVDIYAFGVVKPGDSAPVGTVATPFNSENNGNFHISPDGSLYSMFKMTYGHWKTYFIYFV